MNNKKTNTEIHSEGEINPRDENKINPREIFLDGVNIGGLYKSIEPRIEENNLYIKNIGRYNPKNIKEKIVVNKALVELIFSQIYQTEEKYGAEHSRLIDLIKKYGNSHKELCYNYASKCRPWGQE